MHTCVCVCIYLYIFCLFCWVYLAAGGLSLCFSSIQVALFVRQPVVGPATRHFYRAFIASVSACFSWLSTEILYLSERWWRVWRWVALALHTPDSCLPNSDSLSLLIRWYIPTCILVCVCMYIFVLFLFVFLSIPYSWWPNSLFRLLAERFIWWATSCRPCYPAFLPGFHRFSECACFSWLSTEILSLSEGVDFLSWLDMHLPVFLV